MNKTAVQPDAIMGRMDSLADATRLRLLRLLERHELGVVELCDVLQLPQSTVSRHLKVLIDQGWLRNRRQGTTNLYMMDSEELDASAKRLWALTREQTEDWATMHQDQVRLIRRLRDRRDNAEEFFAGAAGEWDRLRAELYGSSWSTAALLSLLPSHWTVADLGCGTANLTAELAQHVAKVIGVDQSSAMLKAAKRRTDALVNVELRKGALESIPIRDGECDAVMLVLVLTYIAEPAAVLREALRILKPGGKLVIVDLLRHDRETFRRQMGQVWSGFEPEALAGLVRDAGFTEAIARPLAPEPDAKGPALLIAKALKTT